MVSHQKGLGSLFVRAWDHSFDACHGIPGQPGGFWVTQDEIPGWFSSGYHGGASCRLLFMVGKQLRVRYTRPPGSWEHLGVFFPVTFGYVNLLVTSLDTSKAYVWTAWYSFIRVQMPAKSTSTWLSWWCPVPSPQRPAGGPPWISQAAIGAAGDEHSGVDKSGSGYIFVRQGAAGINAHALIGDADWCCWWLVSSGWWPTSPLLMVNN